MSRTSINTWWKQRSEVQQAAILGVGVLVLYKVGKSIFSNDNSGGTSGSLSCGNNVTYPDNQFAIFADAIEAAVWGTWWLPSMTEDDSAIGEILMAMQTTDDVCRLNNKYGIRTRGVLLSDGGNLSQTIHAYLDNDIKQGVNASYAARGINWVWL